MHDLYPTKQFCQVFESDEDFLAGFKESPANGTVSDASVKLTYFLLYAKHGNDPISNSSIDQFKAKVYATIFQYGPTWEKRLEIQRKLREIPEDELLVGGHSVSNHAYNPATEPSTSSLEALNYIDDQTTRKYKKSRMEAYAQLLELLDVDVTEEYTERFRKLFRIVVNPAQFIYESEEEK